MMLGERALVKMQPTEDHRTRHPQAMNESSVFPGDEDVRLRPHAWILVERSEVEEQAVLHRLAAAGHR